METEAVPQGTLFCTDVSPRACGDRMGGPGAMWALPGSEVVFKVSILVFGIHGPGFSVVNDKGICHPGSAHHPLLFQTILESALDLKMKGEVGD